MHKPCSILQKQAKEVNPSTQVELHSCRVSVLHCPLSSAPGRLLLLRWDSCAACEAAPKPLKFSTWHVKTNSLFADLKKWTDKSFMKTNIDLYLEQNKLIQQRRLGTKCLRSSSVEKDGGPWWATGCTAVNRTPWQRWRLTTLWAALARAYQQVRRRHYASLFGTFEAT